jgi:hypothetical protein
MQFKPFEPGIEVLGICVTAYIQACKVFPSAMTRRLAKHGIGTLNGKNEISIDNNAWFPQEKWLRAFEEIANEVGPRACYQIGRNVFDNVPFPPDIRDIQSAVASLDVAYHMNHRRNGKVMFDPGTGQKTAGIGNYGYQPVRNERKIVSVCENPYPCDFDRGMLTEIASRFERSARVTHDEQTGCRKTGGNSCTYTITW